MDFITDFDLTVLDFVRGHLACPFLDILMPAVSFLGNGGWLWIVCALLLTALPKTRRLGLCAAAALVLMFVSCNLMLKPLVARVRPFNVNDVMLLISRPLDFSFPSGHTAAAFTFSSAVFIKHRRAGIPLIVFSALMGFSRMYLYVHYPTDVLAGAVLGILCGFISCRAIDYAYKKKGFN